MTVSTKKVWCGRRGEGGVAKAESSAVRRKEIHRLHLRENDFLYSSSRLVPLAVSGQLSRSAAVISSVTLNSESESEKG